MLSSLDYFRLNANVFRYSRKSIVPFGCATYACWLLFSSVGVLLQQQHLRVTWPVSEAALLRSRFFSCHCGGSRFVHNQLYSFFYLLGGHICLYVWLVDGNYISSLHWESLYAKLIESRDGASVCGGSEVWQRVLAAGGNVRLKRYSTFIKMSLYIPNSCCRI